MLVRTVEPLLRLRKVDCLWFVVLQASPHLESLEGPCAGPAPPSLGAGPLRRIRGQSVQQQTTDNEAVEAC